MPIASFDTLEYARKLEAADVPNKQAEVYVTLLNEALSVNLDKFATKDDLHLLEQRLDAKIDKLDAKIDAKIEKLDTKFEAKFDHLRWMMGVSISLSTAVLALVIPALFVKP